MYFRTQSAWAEKNPIYSVFDDPQNPCFRWRAVELPLAFYCFHVSYESDPTGVDSERIHLILNNFDDALNMVQNAPRPIMYLQTPVWANNGELGLYRVENIFMTVGQSSCYRYFVKCTNGKIYDMSYKSELSDEDLDDKVSVWKCGNN